MTFSKLVRFNAWLGLAFAITLTIVETAFNWGNWSDPQYWIIDYFACALLYGGAWFILRRGYVGGPALLAAGWGFACGMMWMAFFLIRDEATLDPDKFDLIVLYGAGILFAWTLLGLGLSLVSIVRGQEKRSP